MKKSDGQKLWVSDECMVLDAVRKVSTLCAAVTDRCHAAGDCSPAMGCARCIVCVLCMVQRLFSYQGAQPT